MTRILGLTVGFLRSPYQVTVPSPSQSPETTVPHGNMVYRQACIADLFSSVQSILTKSGGCTRQISSAAQTLFVESQIDAGIDSISPSTRTKIHWRPGPARRAAVATPSGYATSCSATLRTSPCCSTLLKIHLYLPDDWQTALVACILVRESHGAGCRLGMCCQWR